MASLGAKPAPPPTSPQAPPHPAPARHKRAATGWTATLGLAGAVPIVAAAVEGLREGATPTGDRAVILTRSFDAFSGHTPLVGQFSASSLLYDHVVHSLGPLLYWLLAAPVRIGPAAPALVAVAAVNLGAIVASVVLARRRGGLAFAVAAAVALALTCGSLSPETLHDAWNPSVALLPFTLLLFVCWSLACGERRLLPLAVVLASFTAQAELVFLVPSAGALALGLVGLLTTTQGRREGAWRWWLAALAAFAVCWSFPLVDELTGHPGNLTLVAEAAFSHGQTIGLKAGWRALVHAVGIPPWWLTSPHDPFGRLGDVKAAPSGFASASCLALLGALASVLLVAIWRRRRDVVSGSAIGLLLCFSLAGMTASMSARPSIEASLGYMLWIGSPIGMFVWLMLIWGALVLLVPALGGAWRRRAMRLDTRLTKRLNVPLVAPKASLPADGRAAFSLLAVGLAAALATGVAVAAGQGSDQDRPEYAPAKAVEAAVREALPAGEKVVLVTGAHSFTAFDFRAAVIYDLRRRGLRVYAPAASERLGSCYEPVPGRTYFTVWVYDEARPPRRGRVIARLTYGSGPPKTVTVMVSHAPWRGRRPALARHFQPRSSAQPRSSGRRLGHH